MTPSEYQRRIRELEDKLEQSREEELWWRDQLRGPTTAYLDPVLKVTAKEQSVVLALYTRAGFLLTKEALLSAIMGPADDEPELKIIDVFICKLRKKLEAIDVEIQTIWGQGYLMPTRSAHRLRPFIMGADQS